MQEFARQFGIIPLHNHNYHGRLYVICPDMGWRERLAEVVYEEGTGRLFANGISHNKLYLQFGAELGLSAAELLNVNYCPEAAAFKTFFQDRCSHNIVEGISCHMLAAEAQGPGLYMHLAERLKKDFGMSDAGVAFWVIHDVADTDHSSVGEELLADFAKTEADRQICFMTLRACARMFETLNEIALFIVPTGTTRFTLAGGSVLCGSPLILSSGGETGCAGLLPKAELGLVAPHACANSQRREID